MKWRISLIPRSFFFLPLELGADIISVVAVFNKASAFYALGALVTSHPLTVVEWVMNIISVFELPFFIYAAYKIMNRDAVTTLLYAYIYFIDTAMNVGFTIYFIVYWFVTGAKKANSNNPTTRSVMDLISRDTTLNKSATFGQELAVTIVWTTFIMLAKLYFTFVVIGFARLLVQHNNLRAHNCEPKGSKKAKLQFALLRPLERFWTGHAAYQRLATYGESNE